MRWRIDVHRPLRSLRRGRHRVYYAPGPGGPRVPGGWFWNGKRISLWVYRVSPPRKV